MVTVSSKIEYPIFSDEESHRAILKKLADNPNLKKVMVVAFWENDTCTTGWGGPIDNGELAMGSMRLNHDVVTSFENDSSEG